MPTRQDVAQGGQASSEAEVEEAMRRAAEQAKEELISSEDSSLELLNKASVDGSWGLHVVSVKIDCLELGDQRIIKDLQSIAQQQLKTKRKQVEGRAAVASANLEREAAIQRAKAEAEVQQTTAQSQAEIQKARAAAQAEVKLAEARAQNEIALLEATNSAKSQAEAKKIELDMQREVAQAEADIEETHLRAKQREAEVEAESITTLADANYQKGVKEQEVAGKMPQQELELARLRLVVEGMQHYGQAKWQNPDEMHTFFEQMKPYLRLGPMSGSELGQVAKGLTAAPHSK